MAYSSLKQAREAYGGLARTILEIDLEDKRGNRPSGSFWTESLTLYLCSGEPFIRDSSASSFSWYEPLVKQWANITDEAHIGGGFGVISDLQIVLHNQKISAQQVNSSYTFASGSPAEDPEETFSVKLSQLMQFYIWAGAVIRIKVLFFDSSSQDQNTATYQVDTIFTGVIRDLEITEEDVILDITQPTELEDTLLPGRVMSDSFDKNLQSTRMPIAFGDFSTWLKDGTYTDETNGIGKRDAVLTGLVKPQCVPAFAHTRIADGSDFWMTYCDTKGVNTGWEYQDAITRAAANDFAIMYDPGTDVITDVDKDSPHNVYPGAASLQTISLETESGDIEQLRVKCEGGILRGTAYVPCVGTLVSDPGTGITDVQNIFDQNPFTAASLSLTSTSNYVHLTFRPMMPLGNFAAFHWGIRGYVVFIGGGSTTSTVRWGLYRAGTNFSNDKWFGLRTKGPNPTGGSGREVWGKVSGAITTGLYDQKDYATDDIFVLHYIDWQNDTAHPLTHWRWIEYLNENADPQDEFATYGVEYPIVLRVDISAVGSSTQPAQIAAAGLCFDYEVTEGGLAPVDYAIARVRRPFGDAWSKMFGKRVPLAEQRAEPYNKSLWIVSSKTTLDDQSGTLTGSPTTALRKPAHVAAGLILKWGDGAPSVNTSNAAVTGGANFGSAYWADSNMLDWQILGGAQEEAQLLVTSPATMGDTLADYLSQWPFLVHRDGSGQIYFGIYNKMSADNNTNRYYGQDTTGPVKAHPQRAHPDANEFGKPYAVWDVRTKMTPLTEIYNRFRIRYWPFTPSGKLIKQMVGSETPNECEVFNPDTNLNDGLPRDLESTLGYDVAAVCAASQDMYGVTRWLELDMPSVYTHHTAALLLNYLMTRFTQQRILAAATGGTEWYDLKPGHIVKFSDDLNLMLPKPEYAKEGAKLTGWAAASSHSDFIVTRTIKRPHDYGVEVRFECEQMMEDVVGTFWDPSDATDVIEHLEADTITGLNNGDSVTSWTATVGTNATQATGIRMPRYYTNLQNGLAGVTFATNDFMELSGFSHGSSEYTFYMVIDQTDLTGTQTFWDTEVGRLIIYAANSSNLAIYESSTTRSDGAAATGAQLLVCTLDAPSSAQFYRNGTAVGSALSYSNHAMGTNTRIGGDISTANFWNGTLYELVLCDTANTAAERALFEGYLAHKWGLEAELPTTHTYKRSPPLVY